MINKADIPIKYILTRDESLIGLLLENYEVKGWLTRLSDRVIQSNVSDIHGSHDYRYENIIGKCFILGMNSEVLQFDKNIRFFLDFLETQITKTFDSKLTFNKMYQYRDFETILSCYMPFLGYGKEPSVKYVAEKRINIIYEFTKQKRYDIYLKNNEYPGANKAWIHHIVDPLLYEDGNIPLPSIHDLILLAGIYPYLNDVMQKKTEIIIEWIFGKGYSQINGTLYYYAPDNPSYKSKGINSKIILPDIKILNNSDIQNLLFIGYILSHFETARNSEWFSSLMVFLDKYRTDEGHFIFPNHMIAEKKDNYVTVGGHMNVGESKKNKLYAEILSTYWMERICGNYT